MIVLPSLSRPSLRTNSGGPSSRRRTERVTGSLLGQSEGSILCPRREVLALWFGKAEPVAAMYAILGNMGLRHPEELRPTFGRGLSCRVCRTAASPSPLDVASADVVDVLRQAFMLGLCSSVLFDPTRPVLWTQASLTRSLELFDMSGFYA